MFTQDTHTIYKHVFVNKIYVIRRKHYSLFPVKFVKTIVICIIFNEQMYYNAGRTIYDSGPLFDLYLLTQTHYIKNLSRSGSVKTPEKIYFLLNVPLIYSN